MSRSRTHNAEPTHQPKPLKATEGQKSGRGPWGATGRQKGAHRKMDLEQAKEQLKDKLPDYLDRAAGRVPNREGKFLCINPEHKDHRPSMGFYTTDKGETRAKCFSCGKNYNLFSAIGAVEGIAISGTS